ncbi:MAG: regulatory protein RecX [Candidatus Dormibacteraceae bacterium]
MPRPSCAPPPWCARGRGAATNRPTKPGASALGSGLNLLARRAHGTEELRLKLRRRGYEVEAVDAAVDRLRALGYLDDREFSSALVRRRSMSRGPSALRAELMAKGIERSLADQVLVEVSGEEQLRAAHQVAARWPRLERQRVAMRLQRRGFEPLVVRRVLASRSDPVA